MRWVVSSGIAVQWLPWPPALSDECHGLVDRVTTGQGCLSNQGLHICKRDNPAKLKGNIQLSNLYGLKGHQFTGYPCATSSYLIPVHTNLSC
mgnify:CR=1 FL=1